MTKKPSEWTPREAWDKACWAMHKRHPFTDKNGFPPFPSDPPERVSDRELRTCGNGYALPTELQRLMALELIERRAKDKEQGR